jgi:N-acetylglucosaminyl-diphospho-decaprenol L-rhamnosyltransferase
VDDPRVTTVIATRDRAPELRRTLPRQQRPVIVVDNASADDTAQVARAIGAQVIELAYNAGAVARNVGAEAAATPYVAFADDDSWWEPGTLDRAAAILDAHPRVAVLAARVLVGVTERLDSVSARMARAPLGRPGDLPGPAVLGFLACSVVVRRSAFLDVGGFSAALHFGCEEELLALDLAAASWGLAYVPDLVVRHHPSDLARAPVTRRRREVRNRLLTAWLRRPLPVIGRAALTALATADGRAGLVAALGRLPALAGSRRRLPADVEAAARRLELSWGGPGRFSGAEGVGEH